MFSCKESVIISNVIKAYATFSFFDGTKADRKQKRDRTMAILLAPQEELITSTNAHHYQFLYTALPDLMQFHLIFLENKVENISSWYNTVKYTSELQWDKYKRQTVKPFSQNILLSFLRQLIFNLHFTSFKTNFSFFGRLFQHSSS